MGGHSFNFTLAINSHRLCQVVQATGHATFVLKGPSFENAVYHLGNNNVTQHEPFSANSAI